MSIPKPGGGERALGIPSVVDRVIQQAIAQVMTPVFDPEFSESSFGFRPRRSAHGAVKQVQAYIKTGYCVAVDLDLAKFFDNVRHDILMARVAPINQCQFLEFTFRRGKLRWSDAAFDDFKHRIRKLTGRSWGVSMQCRFAKLAQYLRGWLVRGCWCQFRQVKWHLNQPALAPTFGPPLGVMASAYLLY